MLVRSAARIARGDCETDMNSETTAFIFPGQGSQTPGMGRDLADAFPVARLIFDRADQALGRPISKICFEASEDELRQTQNTQPALYVTSAAALAVLRSEGFEAGFAAGHSLGEYTALFAAGVFDFETGLRLVEIRARAMEYAGRQMPGAMAAVLSLEAEAIERICLQASAASAASNADKDGEAGRRGGAGGGIVVAANRNSPGQVVLSGDVPAVEAAMELALAAGARRAIRLNVGGAFHSPLMADAADVLREAVGGLELKRPHLRVVANVSAEFIDEPQSIAASLVDQLTSCVRWSDGIRCLVDAGVKDFVEIGPGRVLTGLLKRIDPNVTGHNMRNVKDLEGFRTRSA